MKTATVSINSHCSTRNASGVAISYAAQKTPKRLHALELNETRARSLNRNTLMFYPVPHCGGREHCLITRRRLFWVSGARVPGEIHFNTDM